MFDEMTATLGGRASEEVIFGKVSTGALNDLERVTKQAFNMVVYFGLNDKLGNISYYDSTGQQEYSFQKPYSEKTAELIDKEIKELVERAYKRAVDLLKSNREKLEKLANRLLEKEVIFSEDLEEIFGARPWDEDKRPGENGDDAEKKDEESSKKAEEKEKSDSATDINTVTKAADKEEKTNIPQSDIADDEQKEQDDKPDTKS
jgi:cell division protease FtsH